MVMPGHVLESWTACLRSFSAIMRISAALLRSASDIMRKKPFSDHWRSPAGDHQDDGFLRTLARHGFAARHPDRGRTVLRRLDIDGVAVLKALGAADTRRRRAAVGRAVGR